MTMDDRIEEEQPPPVPTGSGLVASPATAARQAVPGRAEQSAVDIGEIAHPAVGVRKPDSTEFDQADRCPSRDPYGGTLRCARRVHEDDQCQFGGIAWNKDAEPVMSDRERADRLEAMCDRLAARLAELPDLWRAEGRAVMFNRAGDDLTPQGRVGKWLAEKVSPPSSSTPEVVTKTSGEPVDLLAALQRSIDAAKGGGRG